MDEHDAADISYRMVRGYVAVRREEIPLQAGKGVVDAFVPQTHTPGAEAEVDFGDVTVKLAGDLVTCYLLAFRLPYSGKAVHRNQRLRRHSPQPQPVTLDPVRRRHHGTGMTTRTVRSR
ncbi:hypothetical protein P3L51_04950 [Streptomyces sp. PSRA5]|uniref:hypothetical protein n=1 Tax=Streptomyces panacea TaxID=3035064 RepID=UPI00339B9FE7